MHHVSEALDCLLLREGLIGGNLEDFSLLQELESHVDIIFIGIIHNLDKLHDIWMINLL